MSDFNTDPERPWRPPHEIPLDEILLSAIEKLREQGIKYPDKYHEHLLRKYNETGVPYPFIVMRIGEPRIRDHFFYPELIREKGRLLDYGCGTGDAIRQLIADGYPKDCLCGFDVNDRSIGIGMDLYLDSESMKDLFIASEKFPFSESTYDCIYSGSVFHVIHDDDELQEYLANAYQCLKAGGFIFGSTLGRGDAPPPLNHRGPSRLMTMEEIRSFLQGAKFEDIIIKENTIRPGAPRHLAIYEFLARKRE